MNEELSADEPSARTEAEKYREWTHCDPVAAGIIRSLLDALDAAEADAAHLQNTVDYYSTRALAAEDEVRRLKASSEIWEKESFEFHARTNSAATHTERLNMIKITDDGDETIFVRVNEYKFSFDHGEYGWAGMEKVISMVGAIAQLHNIPIENTQDVV